MSTSSRRSTHSPGLNMIGTVAVHDLSLRCIIGIREQERRAPQEILVDFEMDYDIRAAARSGHIEDALDYGKAVDDLSAFIQEAQFELLETLVYRSIYFLHEQFPDALRVYLCASKPEALEGRAVPSVCAEEQFEQGSPT